MLLRELDGPDLHTPVVMAVRGPKAQAMAAELADTVNFSLLPGESRAVVTELAHDFRAMSDVELALRLGLNGTPSYVIGKDVVIGAVGLDELKGKINSARCGKPMC